jgi:tetratricopeptide (TPR) repeat protein
VSASESRSKRLGRAVVVTSILLGVGGCRARPVASTLSDAAPHADGRQTTSPEIVFGNLSASIEALEILYRSSHWPPARAKELVDLLLMRGEFLSRISDYERAAEIAEAAVGAPSASANDYLARAACRATFHRFRDAERDLDRAADLGADPETILAARATVFDAQGDGDRALEIRRRSATARPTILSLGLLAVTLGDRGDLTAAEPLFDRALATYRDVSPIPVAWCHFQRGRLRIEAGQLEPARESLERARRELPQYTTAIVHLAEVEAALGQREAALARLTPVAETSEDPDGAAQLARLLREAGRTEQAEAWRRKVEARYDALLARHEEAFADHAAEFWLGAGANSSKALALAQENLANRKTRAAYRLLARAAAAAGDQATVRAVEAALAALGGRG